MNQMQAMIAQAQKMQRDLTKALNELAEKEFSCSKGGAVTVKMLGSHEISSIDIDKDAFEPDNKEMIEEMIAMAINELIDQIEEEKAEINERITGRREGMGL